MKKSFFLFSLLIVLILNTNSCKTSASKDFLHRQGMYIVNDGGPFIIKAINIGNWMVQESYMMKTQGVFPQHKVKGLINELIGPEKSKAFYAAWLQNFMSEADVILIKKLGFNSIRLPMHYNLFTPPIEDEVIEGQNTWLETGFQLTDSLLSWCSKHEIYLILDLHAAPGGQGKDANINDYDAEKPSLWESDLNKQKTIALWGKLAERYANEAWIGGYDIINETNWSFEEGKNINGIHDTSNIALLELFTKITAAIRANDKNHIIFIEGNGWANNFNGLTPPWDGNMVYSFHHYWQRNVQPSIQKYIDMRTQYNVPIWMGEAGENSNEWFAEAISLLEANEIGWAWWPYKKFESNVSLITVNPSKDYQQIIDYQRNPSVNPRPDEDIAYAALMQLAANHKIEACKVNKSYHDALFRQIKSTATISYADNIVPGTIAAVDYDLGRLNAAYFDKDYANYYISDGGERVVYNAGGAYRNDGVDIYKDETIVGNPFFIDKIESGEWLTYTLDVQESANYTLGFQLLPSDSKGELVVILNDSLIANLAIDAQQNKRNWTTFNMHAQLEKGKVPLKIQFKQGGFAFKSIDFTISDTTVESKN